jgi:NADH-quinone oxidoreductase subunit E
MAWQAIDRRTPVIDEKAPPALSEAVREKIRSFFPRYETKRAALLPALHVVQDALGHVSYQAMKEVAEVLELPPSQVIDTLSFYTHFWNHDKGKKVIVVCRSLSCQVMGSDGVFDAIKDELKIDGTGRRRTGRTA